LLSTCFAMFNLVEIVYLRWVRRGIALSSLFPFALWVIVQLISRTSNFEPNIFSFCVL
jgi:hypothetical protein